MNLATAFLGRRFPALLSLALGCWFSLTEVCRAEQPAAGLPEVRDVVQSAIDRGVIPGAVVHVSQGCQPMSDDTP